MTEHLPDCMMPDGAEPCIGYRERRAEIERLRAALEGMLMEWDKLTRYGSPMAKAANERVAAAHRALENKP